MKRFVQAACVAGAVLFSAVGCSHCCGDKSTSACPDNQCPPGVPAGTIQTAPAGTMAAPGKATVAPASGAPTGYKMPGY
jgi:hypothetical protein